MKTKPPARTVTGLTTNLVINFEQTATSAGFIPGDELFPFVDPLASSGDPNNIAMEALAYLELKAGTHRFGVVSDDAFRVSTGPILTNADDVVLGIFDAGRGAGLPGGVTEFDFYVEQDGLYPVRLVYDEGQGGASVEFYSVDLDTFERVLINDRSNPGVVKAYTGRATQVFVPTVKIISPTNDTLFAIAPTNVTFSVDAALTGGQITKVEYFYGTNKLGEATAAPFNFTFNNAEAGLLTVAAKATGNNGLSATSSAVSFIVGTPVLQINFQAASAETPAGYLADTGEIYGDRGNGHNYGWDVDNTANARDRNSANSTNELYDTFNHMQKPLPAGRVWEVEIPNGRYKVYGVSGDPDNTDSTFDVQAEGTSFIVGPASNSMRFLDGSAIVSVSDGKLTINNGPTASNNKINFLDVWSVPEDSTQPKLNTPTLSGNTFTVTWTGGTLEATTDLAPPVTWISLGSTGNSQRTGYRQSEILPGP